MKFLRGKKTYLAVVGLVMAQVSGIINGDQSFMDVLNWLFVGGGLAAIRAKLGRDSGE
tara:strand:+ start:537 stop:710 length:174 start_codon:yes stop_codon:yes gene_type:complete